MKQRITLFIGTLQRGGAERVMLNLADLFNNRGVQVDLVLTKKKGSLVPNIPAGINVVELKKAGNLLMLINFAKLPINLWKDIIVMLFFKSPAIFKRLPSLVEYIKHNRPVLMLSTLDSVNLVSLMANKIARSDAKIFIRQATYFSQFVQESNRYFDVKLMPLLASKLYPNAEKIIALTQDMKKDLVGSLKLKDSKVVSINNPVNIESIQHRSNEIVEDSWYINKDMPIILSVGRLDKLKDYATLIHAIKLVIEKTQVRLVLLGEGSERNALEQLIKSLSLEDSIKLLGSVSNPYKYMSKSDVFVLSSVCEGFPNVLVEAMACGCTIVSTDCKSGPSEILENGKYGSLVPIRNAQQLSDSILNAIDNKMDKSILFKKVESFSLAKIGDQYSNLLFNVD